MFNLDTHILTIYRKSFKQTNFIQELFNYMHSSLFKGSSSKGSSNPMEQKYFNSMKLVSTVSPNTNGLELEPLLKESDIFDYEGILYQSYVNEGKHQTVRINSYSLLIIYFIKTLFFLLPNYLFLIQILHSKQPPIQYDGMFPSLIQLNFIYVLTK